MSIISISGYGDIAAKLARQYELQRVLDMAKARLKILKEEDFPSHAQDWVAMRRRMANEQVRYCQAQLAAIH